MIDFPTYWPYLLAAVLLLALIIIILLVVVLRKSAKVSTFVDADEPAAGPEEPAKVSDEEIVVSLPEAFRRARRYFRRTDRDIYEVPLYLMVGGEHARDAALFSSAGLDLPWGDAAEAGMHIGMGRGFWFFNRGV